MHIQYTFKIYLRVYTRIFEIKNILFQMFSKLIEYILVC